MAARNTLHVTPWHCWQTFSTEHHLDRLITGKASIQPIWN